MSWEEALSDIGGRIRKAILEKRNEEVMYHVGRPGEDHFVLRMLQVWGVDGHNSHTNVRSASARLGYTLWMGADRPSPDYSQTKFMLLLSSHLETGHYFNPHAQRIIEAKERGARLAVVDTRLSSSPYPIIQDQVLLLFGWQLVADIETLTTGSLRDVPIETFDANLDRRNTTQTDGRHRQCDADGIGHRDRRLGERRPP